MIEETLDIHTENGLMQTFLCRPERGGAFPAVFFLTVSPFHNAGVMTSRRLHAG